MTSTPILARALTLLMPLLAMSACDNEYYVPVEISVSDAVAEDYDEVARGVLVLDVETSISQREHWIICGPESQPIAFESSFGDMGCPSEVEVSLFIAPLPVDDARPCGALDEVDSPVEDFVLDQAWPQVTTTLINPCRSRGELLTLEIE